MQKMQCAKGNSRLDGSSIFPQPLLENQQLPAEDSGGDLEKYASGFALPTGGACYSCYKNRTTLLLLLHVTSAATSAATASRQSEYIPLIGKGWWNFAMSTIFSPWLQMSSAS